MCNVLLRIGTEIGKFGGFFLDSGICPSFPGKSGMFGQYANDLHIC